jgi:uncharacterized protein DUF4175
MESELRSFIAQVRRRWFRLVALRTIGRAGCAAAIPIGAGVLAEALLRPQGWPLLLLAGSAIALSLAAAGIVLYRTQRRPDDRHVARYIEERASAAGERFDDEIVSAVDIADGHVHPGGEVFKPLILADALRRLQAIDPSVLVDGEQLRRARVEAAGGLCLVAAILALGIPSLRRAAETAWLAAVPDAIQVEVLPGNAKVVRGQPLEIAATIRGKAAAVARISPQLVVSAGADRRTVGMVRDGDRYRFEFESVDRTFRYRVTAGTASSPEYTVSALVAPRVERIDLHYQYPPFSGLAPREEEDGGDIYAPAGTRVRLRIHTDKPVSGGELALGAGKIALRPAGDKLLEGELTLAQDDSYRVHLTDAESLQAASDSEYFIRLMDDRPPDVRILRPSSDQQITPLEEVAIEARADDDYGISTFELVYSVSGKPPRVVAFNRISGTAIQKTGAYVLPAEELGVQPGDVITYYARARDVGRGKRPTETKSDMFFLEVKPFGEEFVAAQSQGGAGGGAAGAQIEALIAAQKEIINATWNIERRSGGGRSEADIKALADAQAELRARVEQMSRGGSRGRGEFPQRLAPSPQSPAAQPRGADPIGTAVSAMARAHEQLEARKTGEAMPHEMAALNALLQAQAEVRRRQVAQQRAGATGSGGSNRTGEDLSALFDKELQRQQRTNYETRSQVEERPERKEGGDSALDRIRDLARRQEELNRQQRELANGNLSAEEIKRRLEKLTREQAELRQQAEELSRSQQGQGASAMRDAAENMRNATSDLRRQDAQGAAQKGERAAEQLRRLEQQGRGGPGAGSPSAGQLQMEAQQISDAQRRIAAEAERLERDSGAAAGEARRRLADEKDRLAGRVEELQRAARQAAQQRPSTDPGQRGRGDANAAAEAARALEREQVGQRMRDTAKQMRGGGKTSAGEQQIARTLDQVVDKLGGDSGDARRLAQELNQTRDIRDRLNRLEQQIREAEAGQRGGGRGQPAQRGQPGRGRSGEGGGSGDAKAADLQQLREQYRQELQRAREALARLNAQHGEGGATPEQHEYSRSAPGTESFKQDRSGWDGLRKDVDLALERYEAAVSDRLGRKTGEDRLSAGGSDRVPDKYRDLVAAYFQSLAKGKRK